MHLQYPIECKCFHRKERFQLAFARKALELLPQSEDTAFETSREGLTLLGETESALERPIQVLREVYGDELHVASPSVRYLQGDRIEEPHMGLRVLCAPQYFHRVRSDLRKRGAMIQDAEVNNQFGVVRACAPLAALVGYPTRIKELTASQGKLVMWLSHYAPLHEPPPSAA